MTVPFSLLGEDCTAMQRVCIFYCHHVFLFPSLSPSFEAGYFSPSHTIANRRMHRRGMFVENCEKDRFASNYVSRSLLCLDKSVWKSKTPALSTACLSSLSHGRHCAHIDYCQNPLFVREKEIFEMHLHSGFHHHFHGLIALS